MILTLDEVKNYIKVDQNDDDTEIMDMILAAEAYLSGATGKEYPETNEEGDEIDYPLEKLYLKRLIAYWYEHRDVVGSGKGADVPEEFTYSTRSLMLQLQLRE